MIFICKPFSLAPRGSWVLRNNEEKRPQVIELKFTIEKSLISLEYFGGRQRLKIAISVTSFWVSKLWCYGGLVLQHYLEEKLCILCHFNRVRWLYLSVPTLTTLHLTGKSDGEESLWSSSSRYSNVYSFRRKGRHITREELVLWVASSVVVFWFFSWTIYKVGGDTLGLSSWLYVNKE